jgi:signal transduction histidine kinase
MDDRALIERVAAVLTAAAKLAGAELSNGESHGAVLADAAVLAAELPQLAARLERLDELENRFAAAVETAKLDALKELAYGASHELNNPLANISARAQTLLQEERDPERRRRLAAINSQAFRAHEMIADMMLFARPPQLERRPVDLVGLLDDLVRRLAEEAGQQNTELVRVGEPGPIEARVDPVQLRAALRALVINALEALADDGRIELSVGPVAGRAGAVQIVVADNGPGIPAEVREHLFDPFFSGREAGRGLGLGLSKCWRIVREHRGRIDVGDNDSPAARGRGARFTITLPLEI